MANRINVNLASQEELVQLPGIGEVISRRIMANRPYESAEDLARVQGINSITVDRLASFLTFTDETVDEVIALPPREEMEMLEEPVEEQAEEIRDKIAWDKVPDIEKPELETEVETESGMDEHPTDESGPQGIEEEAAPEPEIPTEESKPPEKAIIPVGKPVSNGGDKSQPRMISQGDAVLLSVGSSVAALVLSFILTLLVLGAINGGLRFVRPEQMSVLSSDLDIAGRQIDALQEDLESLQTRVSGFDSLGGRVTSLETDITGVKTDLSQLESQLEALDTNVAAEIESIGNQVAAVNELSDELALQVEELQTQTSGFQEFLNGLRDLLSNVLTNPFGGDR